MIGVYIVFVTVVFGFAITLLMKFKEYQKLMDESKDAKVE